jgi:hypothetical protein
VRAAAAGVESKRAAMAGDDLVEPVVRADGRVLDRHVVLLLALFGRSTLAADARTARRSPGRRRRRESG